MKQIFCTLFDKNYLSRGIVLHASLVEHSSDFLLYILCMDDLAFDILDRLTLKQVILIKLSEFENDALLEVKKERTVAEYSWTCASNLCRYILENKNTESITYLDADMKFYADPKVVFDEMGNGSIAIIEHRFVKARKYLEGRDGKYNVSWITFRNNEEGLRAVRWWSDNVLAWCYNRHEGGKFGDQKYLDEFPVLFKDVKVIQTKGAGIAPWNAHNHRVSLRDQRLFIDDDILVFYHFHTFRLSEDDRFIPAGHYYIPKDFIQFVYIPYFKDIKRAIKLIKGINKDFHFAYRTQSLFERFIQIFFQFQIFESFFLIIKRVIRK